MRLPNRLGTFAGPCLGVWSVKRVTVLLNPLADNRRVEVIHGAASAGFVEPCGPGTGARIAAACKSGRDQHVKVLMATRQVVREVGAASVSVTPAGACA